MVLHANLHLGQVSLSPQGRTNQGQSGPGTVSWVGVKALSLPGLQNQNCSVSGQTLEDLQNVWPRITHKLAIPLQSLYLKELNRSFYAIICTLRFKGALCTTAKMWKPECPSMEEWINTLQGTIQQCIIQPHKEMKDWYMPQPGYSSKIALQIKAVSHKRPHPAWSHLYRTSGIAKSIDSDRRLEVSF